MSSMFDMYLKNNIMSKCEDFFNDYLKREGALEEKLTEDERESVSEQVDYLIEMMQDICAEHDDGEEEKALIEIIDKLFGFGILAKMNEARFCRLLNKKEN